MDIYPTSAELIRAVPLELPFIGVRPHAAKRAALWFTGNFPGETLYAVKANDSPAIISALLDGASPSF